jgi:hypothetical protein
MLVYLCLITLNIFLQKYLKSIPKTFLKYLSSNLDLKKNVFEYLLKYFLKVFFTALLKDHGGTPFHVMFLMLSKFLIVLYINITDCEYSILSNKKKRIDEKKKKIIKSLIGQ